MISQADKPVINTMSDLLEQTRSLCVMTAAEIEFNIVAGLLPERREESSEGIRLCRGQYENRRITVLLSEIGAPGFTEKLSAHLSRNQYSGLLIIGLAGALDDRLRVGDTVIYDSCCRFKHFSAGSFAREKRDAREEFASRNCDPALSAVVCEKLQAGRIHCLRVRGVTAERIIVSAAEKDVLHRLAGAAVVDMETHQVMTVCTEFHLPVTVVRVISDEANQTLPDFNYALNQDGKISGTRALVVLVRRPAAALRFLLNLRLALRALKRTTAAIMIRLTAEMD